MMQRHEKWAVYHGRRYKDPTEKAKRYKIFKANVEYIDEVNSAGDKPYKLGVNAFADQTNEEFRKSLKGFKSPTEKSIAATSFSSKNVAAVPPRIDWRKKGAVTPLRNETCGKPHQPYVTSHLIIQKYKMLTNECLYRRLDI